MKFIIGQYTTEDGSVANVTSIETGTAFDKRKGKIFGDVPGHLVSTWWWDDGKHNMFTNFNLKEKTMKEKDNEMIVNALNNQGYKTVDETRKEPIVNIQEQPTKWNADLDAEVTICCYCMKLCYLEQKETWCEHAIKDTFRIEGEYDEYEVHGILFSFDRTKIPVYDPKLDSSQWCRCPKCDYVRMCNVSDDGDHISFNCTNCQFLDVDGTEIPLNTKSDEAEDLILDSTAWKGDFSGDMPPIPEPEMSESEKIAAEKAADEEYLDNN
jgi:hypothetical protein